MEKLEIRGMRNSEEVEVASVKARGSVTARIMGEELVNLGFTLPYMIHFLIGDRVKIYGVDYYLLQVPNVEKVNSRQYKYSLQFGSVKYELGRIQMLLMDSEGEFNISEFSVIGDAELILEHVIRNANRVQKEWKKGKIDETEAKQIDFSGDNCLSALSKISEAFDIEYRIDSDRTVHLTERKIQSGYSFEYGRNKGLKSINRNVFENSNVFTRLYVFGGEKNIGRNYRNGSKRLKLGVPYLERNIGKYGVIEHIKKFDDIFPKRIGVVTEIDKNNPFVFSDETLDFDLNERDENGTKYLVKGVSAKVTFQTGQLAGYTLEVKEYGYNSPTKSFTLLKNKDENDIEVPSELICPKVGDKYILTDIVMPEKYINSAEAELKEKAEEYLNKNSNERVQYTVESDPLYFREIKANIVLGETVRIKDSDMDLDSELRILSVNRDLENPYKISFELGEAPEHINIVRSYIEKERKTGEINHN